LHLFTNSIRIVTTRLTWQMAGEFKLLNMQKEAFN